MSKSIVFVKFKSLIENEIRSFWHIQAALEYSERWLTEKSPQTLASAAGDNKYPFKAIDITPAQYMNEQEEVRSRVRENALISFVTAFESYLGELLERLIYLDPCLVSDSDLQIPAKDLTAIAFNGDIRKWIGGKIADKYLRNKTHKEMISRLDVFCKAGISKNLLGEIQEWSQWSLVRNSIAHTARQVTGELSTAWPQRFPSKGGSLKLKNSELARVHHLALKIAEALDKRAVATIIKKSDALLLIKEIFVHRGTTDPSALKHAAIQNLSTKLTRPEIERALSEQRRGNFSDKWELTNQELQLITQ